MKDFITWESISHVTGVTMVTGLITQLLKNIVPIPTQILAYIVATLVLIGCDIKNKNFSGIPLSLINGFVAASIASNSVSLVNRLC